MQTVAMTFRLTEEDEAKCCEALLARQPFEVGNSPNGKTTAQFFGHEVPIEKVVVYPQKAGDEEHVDDQSEDLTQIATRGWVRSRWGSSDCSWFVFDEWNRLMFSDICIKENPTRRDIIAAESFMNTVMGDE